MSERARHTDPPTSHDAGDSVKSLTAKQHEVWVVLRGTGPCGDEKLIAEYMSRAAAGGHVVQTESGIRTRRHELVLRGVAVDTGRRGKTRAGRTCILWDALALEDWPAGDVVPEGEEPPPEALFDDDQGAAAPRSAVLGDDGFAVAESIGKLVAALLILAALAVAARVAYEAIAWAIS